MIELSLEATPTDGASLRLAFACLPQPMCAVGALDEAGHPRGLVVSTLAPVSLEPPLVSVCVARSSTTWPTLRAAPRLGLSVLADDQARACEVLGSRRDDRFAEVDWRAGDGGEVTIDGAVSWMTGTVVDELPGGDHLIVVIRLSTVVADEDREPLVFHGSRFRPLGDG